MDRLDKKESKSTNINWQKSKVTAEQREGLVGQKGCVIWLTGLSGSGKSTIAALLEEHFIRSGHLAFVLDGDNIRHGLNGDLSFSPEDRSENIRRVGQVAALFCQSGVITIVSFISPYAAGRDAGRKAAGAGRFIEVYLDTPLDVCEKRDAKGLYKKARAGEIPDFTGIDAPYQVPEKPELTIETGKMTPQESAAVILDYFAKCGAETKKS